MRWITGRVGWIRPFGKSKSDRPATVFPVLVRPASKRPKFTGLARRLGEREVRRKRTAKAAAEIAIVLPSPTLERRRVKHGAAQ